MDVEERMGWEQIVKYSFAGQTLIRGGESVQIPISLLCCILSSVDLMK